MQKKINNKPSYKEVIENKKNEAKKFMTEKQIKEANLIIHSASALAAAGGAIPIPVADAIPISAAQITMIVSLGKIFNKKINESAAKAIIGAAASTLVGRTLVKAIPVVGWGISAAVSAGITEAIGWTAAVDFALNENKEDSDIETDDVGEDNNDGIKNDEYNQNDDLDEEGMSKDIEEILGED